MISASYNTEWAAEHPWRANEQIEQDLLLSRALVALFSDPFLCEALAFRGGTVHGVCPENSPRWSPE